MTRRLLALILLVTLVGCNSSSKASNSAVTTTSATPTTPRETSPVSDELCQLPTAAELSGILGMPVTRRSPGTGARAGSGISAPRCILVAGRTQLAIGVFTVSDAAAMRPILAAVRQGKSGMCSQVVTRSSNTTVYDCTSTAANAPDFSGAPEVTVRAFVGRSAVIAGWTGAPGAPLPTHPGPKLARLRTLASAAVERYAKS